MSADLAAGVRHARNVLTERFHMWQPHLDALDEEAARLDRETMRALPTKQENGSKP